MPLSPGTQEPLRVVKQVLKGAKGQAARAHRHGEGRGLRDLRLHADKRPHALFRIRKRLRETGLRKAVEPEPFRRDVHLFTIKERRPRANENIGHLEQL
jgi:hypothetical protein